MCIKSGTVFVLTHSNVFLSLSLNVYSPLLKSKQNTQPQQQQQSITIHSSSSSPLAAPGWTETAFHHREIILNHGLISYMKGASLIRLKKTTATTVSLIIPNPMYLEKRY